MGVTQVVVGMGEIRTIQGESEFNVLGVGSGVVLAAYDSELKVGACAHFILPEPPFGLQGVRPGKYVATGVTEMLRQMSGLGVGKHRIRAALAGGAGMASAGPTRSSEMDSLGARNVAAVLRLLDQLDLHCVAKEVGGHEGRSVTMDIESGAVKVRSGNRAEHLLCRLGE